MAPVLLVKLPQSKRLVYMYLVGESYSTEVWDKQNAMTLDYHTPSASQDAPPPALPWRTPEPAADTCSGAQSPWLTAE